MMSPERSAASKATSSAAVVINEQQQPISSSQSSSSKSQSWMQMTRTIAHYTICEQIGLGTYGEVYRAICNDTQQIVALKKMRIQQHQQQQQGDATINSTKKRKHITNANATATATATTTTTTTADAQQSQEQQQQSNEQQGEQQPSSEPDPNPFTTKINIKNNNKHNNNGSSGMSLQLIREIKILKSLQHSNLLSMIEVVTNKGVEEHEKSESNNNNSNEATTISTSATISSSALPVASSAVGTKNDSNHGNDTIEENDLTIDQSKIEKDNDKDKHDVEIDVVETTTTTANVGTIVNSKPKLLLFDYELYKGNLFLVLEYMTHDLAGLFDMGYQFTIVQQKCILQQLFTAIQYMHQNKYIHRDIKSSNILLNDKYQLKLADFGLARNVEPPLLFYEQQQSQQQMSDAYSSSSSAAANSTTGSAISSSSIHTGYYGQDLTNKVITLWYRPPELLFGTVQYGCAVDIWSIGCILIELMNRGKPFAAGKTELEQIQYIIDILGTPDVNTWEYIVSLKKTKSLSSSINTMANEYKEEKKRRRSSKLRNKYGPNRIASSSSKQKQSSSPDGTIAIMEPIPETAITLLEKILEWDPRKRITATSALQHRYFWSQPVPPSNPAELGTIELHHHNDDGNNNGTGHYHEFITKQKRKNAKAEAEKVRNDAIQHQGVSVEEANRLYDETYAHCMKNQQQSQSQPNNAVIPATTTMTNDDNDETTTTLESIGVEKVIIGSSMKDIAVDDIDDRDNRKQDNRKADDGEKYNHRKNSRSGDDSIVANSDDNDDERSRNSRRHKKKKRRHSDEDMNDEYSSSRSRRRRRKESNDNDDDDVKHATNAGIYDRELTNRNPDDNDSHAKKEKKSSSSAGGSRKHSRRDSGSGRTGSKSKDRNSSSRSKSDRMDDKKRMFDDYNDDYGDRRGRRDDRHHHGRGGNARSDRDYYDDYDKDPHLSSKARTDRRRDYDAGYYGGDTSRNDRFRDRNMDANTDRYNTHMRPPPSQHMDNHPTAHGRSNDDHQRHTNRELPYRGGSDDIDRHRRSGYDEPPRPRDIGGGGVGTGSSSSMGGVYGAYRPNDRSQQRRDEVSGPVYGDYRHNNAADRRGGSGGSVDRPPISRSGDNRDMDRPPAGHHYGGVPPGGGRDFGDRYGPSSRPLPQSSTTGRRNDGPGDDGPYLPPSQRRDGRLPTSSNRDEVSRSGPNNNSNTRDHGGGGGDNSRRHDGGPVYGTDQFYRRDRNTSGSNNQNNNTNSRDNGGQRQQQQRSDRHHSDSQHRRR